MTDAAAGVTCTVEVPVDFVPGLHGDDWAALALTRLLGLEALQGERQPLQDAHTPTPEWRTQAQLDLVLDALRELHQQLVALPRPYRLRLSPERICPLPTPDGRCWVPPDTAQSPGWMKLWLDVRMPQPVLLPVAPEAEGFSLRSLNDELDTAIASLMFRLHRREIARQRRAAQQEAQR
jgi:hypothetical protein